MSMFMKSTSGDCYERNETTKSGCFEIGITKESYGILRLRRVAEVVC